ncbi:alkaline protease, partial [Myriangium duriaei CBS 260.36]
HGISHQYAFGDFRGFAGQFSRAVVAQISRHKHVSSIVSDRLIGYDEESQSQTKATWGLHHMSHYSKDNPKIEEGIYWYNKTAGAGTFGYVIDGAVNVNHVDIRGRATKGYNALGSSYPFKATNGHATYVSSIMCGRIFGVSKLCNIISVQVVQWDFTNYAMVLDGFQWAVKDILEKKRQAKAVINISLELDHSSPVLDKAIHDASRKGITTVVAAGNGGRDIRMGTSPATASSAIVVGAVDVNFTRWKNSNYGKNVSLFAPGVSVKAAWLGGIRRNQACRTATGTSAAAPHVAGLVLYYKSLE